VGSQINSREIISNSPEETILTGKLIASRLLKGSVVALNGTLGSGKTYLTKGIALGLGVKDNITSPTYTIINEYQTDRNDTAFYHIDVYRINDDRDFENINGPEIIQSDGISVIEWSGRIPRSLPDDKISVNIEITGASSRLIKIEGISGL